MAGADSTGSSSARWPSPCCAPRTFPFSCCVPTGRPSPGRSGPRSRHPRRRPPMPFRRVLVPLDGSALAEGVIPLLESIAGPLDLEVTLLRVLQPLPPEIIEGTRHLVIEDVEAR